MGKSGQYFNKAIRVAVVNLKGGVGKTTIATAAALRWGAFLVDVDPQGDSHDWASRSGLVRSIHVRDWSEAVGLVEQEAGSVVLDCPPGEGPALRAALAVADVALVPTKSSAQDMRAVGRMLHLVRDARAVNPGLRVGLILNEAKGAATATRDTAADLAGLEGVTFLGVVASRQAIPDAFTNGAAVAHGPAKVELDAVFSALEKELGGKK